MLRVLWQSSPIAGRVLAWFYMDDGPCGLLALTVSDAEELRLFFTIEREDNWPQARDAALSTEGGSPDDRS